MEILIWLSLAGIVAWYWADTTKTREIAIAHGRRACKEMNLQFLDGTVVRYSTKPKRAPGGQMCFCRDFSFEFTPDGQNRYPGHLCLVGKHLQLIDLNYPEQESSHSNNLILNAEYTQEKQSRESGNNIVQMSDFRKKQH